jgi:hypothetical protein
MAGTARQPWSSSRDATGNSDKSIADIGRWEEHDRTVHPMLFTLHGRTGGRR